MSFQLKLESYNEQQKKWPQRGRIFLSQFDDFSVTVYRTVADQKRCDRLRRAEEQTKIIQKVLKVNDGSTSESESNSTETAMSSKYETKESVKDPNEPGDSRKNSGNEEQPEEFVWLQTGFVRTMYSCDWGKRSNHEKVIAILMRREGFDELLRAYVANININNLAADVRMEWKPDRSPTGEILKRFVPEIGIRGNILQQFHKVWILGVKDISDYVEHQRRFIDTGKLNRIWTPDENVYIPESFRISSALALVNAKCDIAEETVDLSSTESITVTLAEAYSHVDSSDLLPTPTEPREAILYLYGAFNPVHMGHVNALVESKHWLENVGKYQVLASRMAIASDNNIKGKYSKSEDHCIKFEHRLKLCELACSDYPWIKVYPNPVHSQPKFGEQLRKELKKPEATLVVLMGSDRAVLTKRRVKHFRTENRIVLCVGRKGMSQTEEKNFKEAEKNDPKHSFEFFVVPAELNEISSTGVRHKLMQVMEGNAEITNESVINEMIELGWIADEEGEYIFQHKNDMYF